MLLAVNYQSWWLSLAFWAILVGQVFALFCHPDGRGGERPPSGLAILVMLFPPAAGSINGGRYSICHEGLTVDFALVMYYFIVFASVGCRIFSRV